MAVISEAGSQHFEAGGTWYSGTAIITNIMVPDSLYGYGIIHQHDIGNSVGLYSKSV